MKIKLLTGMVRVENGRNVSYPAGATLALPDAEAGRFITRGMAVSAETGRPARKPRARAPRKKKG